MPITNSDHVQHGIGLEKANAVNSLLLPQPAGEPGNRPRLGRRIRTFHGWWADGCRRPPTGRKKVLCRLVAPTVSVIRRVGRSVIPTGIRGIAITAVPIVGVAIPATVIPAVIGVSRRRSQRSPEGERAEPNA